MLRALSNTALPRIAAVADRRRGVPAAGISLQSKFSLGMIREYASSVLHPPPVRIGANDRSMTRRVSRVPRVFQVLFPFSFLLSSFFPFL